MTPQQIGCLQGWCWSLGRSIDFSSGFGNFAEESWSPCYLLASLQMYLKKKCLMNFKPEWACFACKVVVFSLSCQPVRIIRLHLTSSEPCCHQGLLGRKHEVPYDGKKPFCLHLVTSLCSWHFSSGFSLLLCDCHTNTTSQPPLPSDWATHLLSLSFGLAHWSHSSGWHQRLPKLSYLF